MGFYLVGGKLGAGKTLCSVGVIRAALLKGKRVATNLDLFLDKMLPRESLHVAIRLPDKPTIVDLEAIGTGQEGIEEENNGVLVLDECASWLNARTWNDPDRQAVLNWMLHSRKLGWDVYLITQHMDQVDKQLRTSLIEFSVRCSRLDRLPVPFLSSLLKVLSLGIFKLRLPKVHLATVRYGTEREALVVDRLFFRARELYAAYDTRQVFKDDHMIPVKGETGSAVAIPHVGIHTMLSPWHTYGRYTPRRTWAQVVRELWSPPPRKRVFLPVAPRLAPLLALPVELRFRAARQLVLRGVL